MSRVPAGLSRGARTRSPPICCPGLAYGPIVPPARPPPLPCDDVHSPTHSPISDWRSAGSCAAALQRWPDMRRKVRSRLSVERATMFLSPFDEAPPPYKCATGGGGGNDNLTRRLGASV